MREASWGEAGSPGIDWRISAALENVPRGDGDLAEVTSLEMAVRAWLTLDPAHRADATLTPEHSLVIDGVSMATFSGEGIAVLAKQLPESEQRAPSNDDMPDEVG